MEASSSFFFFLHNSIFGIDLTMRKAHEEAIQRLQTKMPEATLHECMRFQTSFGKQSAKYLKEYIHWRSTYYSIFQERLQCNGVLEDCNEQLLWQEAAAIAMALYPNNENSSEDGNDETVATSERSFSNSSEDSRVYSENIEIDMNGDTMAETPKVVCEIPSKSLRPAAQQLSQNKNNKALPRFLYSHKKVQCDDSLQRMHDLHGNILLQALPAQMETDFTPEQYTMALALFLEHLLGDDESKQATILLDVRPGRGWPNANVVHMVGFIRHIANTLHNLHPNRLCKCVIFPIPRPAIAIWNFAIKPFLDSKLRQLIELVPGSGAMIKSPPPNDKLKEFCTPGDLKVLEQHRIQCFRTSCRVVAGNQKRESRSDTPSPAAARASTTVA